VKATESAKQTHAKDVEPKDFGDRDETEGRIHLHASDLTDPDGQLTTLS
jgi:hypothetical protein